MSDDDLTFYYPTEAEQRARDRSRDLYEKAAAAGEAGKYEKAIGLMREALEVGRGGADEWHLRFLEGRLADLLISNDQADEAQSVLEASLVSSAAMRAKARNESERRNAEELPASLGMLHQLYYARDDYDGLVRLFRSYEAEKARTAALPYFSGAETILSLARRTATLAEGGVWEDRPLQIAIDLAREVGNRAVEFAARHERGAAAEALGDNELAISTYKDLLARGSRHEPTITRLLILLERDGRSAEALAVARGLSAEPLDRELKAALEKRIERLAKKKEPVAEPRQSDARPFDDSTFGRRARDAANAEGLLALEAEAGAGQRFADLDRILIDLVSDKLSGQLVADASDRRAGWRLTALRPADRPFIEEAFSRQQLEARGAWFLPERVPTEPSADGKAAASGDPIFAWALLNPLLDALHRPLELRELSSALSSDKQKTAWQGVADLFSSLGIDARLELDSMAYGGGWSRLKADERRAVQARLRAALVEWAPLAVRRYRALKILELVRAYYAKADADGRALRTRVTTAALRPTMVGYFRGDWLTFLDYLGEKPHPGEQIVTSLPEAKVIVAGSERIAAAAAELGVSPEQAAIIGQALWGAGESPVEARVAALKGFWQTFDAIHARQEQGMPSLWGLIEERWDLGSLNSGPGEHNSALFRKALPPQVRDEIERLWGGELVPAWPDKIVSAISPHFLAAETFGTALSFWHGVALTAWFVCEGPMSRTSIEDMEEYYGRDLQNLAALETPIDRAMFRDLLAVRKTLKTKPRKPESTSKVEVAEGISFELSLSFGPDRLEGFSKLRDVITRYRRAWAAAYLDAYLRKRWDAELRGAANTYSRMTAESNKPPTVKAFARKVETSIDHWFGGDVAALYTSIGAKCPISVTRADRVLPTDQFVFVDRLVAELRRLLRSQASSQGERGDWDLNRGLSELARLAVKTVQMSEALGRMPTLKEAGAPAFERAQKIRVGDRDYRTESALAEDPEAAFSMFIRAIEAALERTRTSETTARPSPSLPIQSARPIAPTAPEPLVPASPAEPKQGLLGRLFGRRLTP